MEIRKYAPEFINRRFSEQRSPPSSAGGDEAECAVLWCDVCDFVGLTERLVAGGPAGVESLTGYLNAYYHRLVGLVHAHGGDVLEFAGDALLAVWRVPEGGAAGDEVLRAAACALEVQAELTDYEVSPEIRLSLRVAVGVGGMRFSWIGGVLSYWLVAASGEPLAQTRAIDHDVDPGQVVVSARAWALVADRCEGASSRGGGTRLLATRAGPPRSPLARCTPPPEAEAALRAFLPGAVLARLDAGTGRWLAELRTISVLFVRMGGLSPEDPGALSLAHEATVQCQEAIYRQEGAVSKISMADKGATILASFGLPPLAHEDDPVRAVSAAMDVVERLAGLGIVASVGVTTGRVFCGLLGGEDRCEYTTIGRPVNVAARLMTLLERGVLVDGATWRASERRLGYEALEPVQVKGVPEPVEVYRPTGEVRAAARPTTRIVGRRAELARVSEQLQAVLRRGDGGVLLLEGEAGIGKSRLVLEAVRLAVELAVRPLVVAAQAIEKETVYFAWRDALRDLLGVDTADPAGRAERLQDALGDDAELRRLLPLLGAVLSVDLPDNDHTAPMRGEVRAANTRTLVTRLVQRLAAVRPLLLVVEDAQWLDSSSWALLVEVASAVRPLAVLIATRPFEEEPPELEALRPFDRATLDRLSAEDTIQLVCQRLGVVGLPGGVGRLLTGKADGNPYFAEELAFSLRDSGHLLIDGGTCGLAPGRTPADLVLPATVEGAVISRVDRLSPASQLTLKVASVIGREFLQRILEGVYPSQETGDRVAELLPSLVDQDIVLRESGGDDPAYGFKHALGQQAIYGLMPYAQRREWHAAVAACYERQGERREALLAVLAWHWTLAERPREAFGYLCQAAEQAIARYACREAVRFYERALALCEQVPSLADAHEVAVLEEGLSRALYGTGDAERTQVCSARALALFGRSVPRTPVAGLFGLLGGAVRAARQARRPERWEVTTDREREAALLSARMWSTRAEIAVFREDAGACLHSALQQLIEARSLGPSPELARAYAILSNMLAVIPMRKTCAAWTRRSIDMVDELGDRIDRAWVYSRAAAYTGVTVQWEESHRLNVEASAIATEIGDRRLYEESEGGRGTFLALRGRNAEAVEALDDCIRSSRVSGNAQSAAWSHAPRAEVLVRMGRTEAALQAIDRLRPWLDGDQPMASERVMVLAVHALTRALSGQLEAALEDADQVDRTFLATRPVGYWTCHAAPQVARVYQLAAEQGAADRRAALRVCRRAVKHMKVASKLFLFCEPMALTWQGRVQLMEGKTARALTSWRRGAARAEALGCERDLALCKALLGRHLPAGEERDRLAAEGRAMLEQAGATADLAEFE